VAAAVVEEVASCLIVVLVLAFCAFPKICNSSFLTKKPFTANKLSYFKPTSMCFSFSLFFTPIMDILDPMEIVIQ